MTKPLAAKNAAAKAFEAFDFATFTIGTEAADTINVAVQLKDARGVALAQVCHLTAYLCDVATGVGITATVPTSTLAIGTNGKIVGILTTDKVLKITTDASGRFDLNVIQTAAPVTYYLIICHPNGSVFASAAITFA